MTDHTAPDLLEAVGVDWRKKYGRILCAECGMTWQSNDTDRVHFSACRRPSTRDLPLTYTGPALGTPELDKELLVAGVRYMYELDYSARKAIWKKLASSLHANSLVWSTFDAWLACSKTPGHALARAIAEVRG